MVFRSGAGKVSAGDQETAATCRLSFAPNVAALDAPAVEELGGTDDAVVVDETMVVGDVWVTVEATVVEDVARAEEVVAWLPLEQPAVKAAAIKRSAQSDIRRDTGIPLSRFAVASLRPNVPYDAACTLLLKARIERQ